MRYILIIILALNTLSVWSQTGKDSIEVNNEKQIEKKLIIHDTVRTHGIYHTFEDFKYNTPDTSIEFRFNEETNKVKGHITVYSSETDKWEKYEEEYWGVCDGEKDYKHSNEMFNAHFEISNYGRYLTYVVNSRMYLPAVPMGPGSYPGGSISSVSTYYFDIITGERKHLYKKTLLRLLSDDKELQERYKKHKKKNKSKVWFMYLKEYNERNPVK